MATLIPKYTRVSSANRTIAQKFAETISIKDYGATGDGVTDDTAAIQAAITYAASINGCNIFVPQGTYACNSAIIFPATSIGISLIGEGRDNTLLGGAKIVYTGTAAKFISFADITSRFITFDNLDISASNAAFTGTLIELQVYDLCLNQVHLSAITAGATALINILSSVDVYMTQCFFRDATNNVLGAAVNACVFDQCDFGAYTSYAVNITSAQATSFIGCAFEQNADNVRAGGITGSYQGLNVTGCWFGDVVTLVSSPTSAWISIQGRGVNITGNYFNGDGFRKTSAIVITAASSGITVTSNWFSAFDACLDLGSNLVTDATFMTNSFNNNNNYFVTGTLAGGTLISQNWVFAASSAQLNLTGSLSATYLRNSPVAVSSLPAANTIGAGSRSFVCDATGTTYGTTVASTTTTLAGVVITGTAGQFSCTAATLAVGMPVVISGTFGGTGSIAGYSSPTTYYIAATNGTTTFTLSYVFNDISGVIGVTGIITSAGTPTGLTYTISTSTNRVPVYSDGSTWKIG
jgi:hypothetical protein